MSHKLGISKATVHSTEFDKTVAHKHVPGRAYVHTDPTTKLITMIGGGFFNEPRYYDTNRDAFSFYSELLTTGKISSVITDASGMSEQARDVVEAAQAVANSDNPEDLLIIAAWARDPEKGLKLRYTPQIMLCIAAANPKTRPYVRKYASKIIRRADEIRQVFAAYRHLFCKKENGRYKGHIPHCLKKALALALHSQSEYSLLKYNAEDHPTFKDVILMVGGRDTLKACRDKNIAALNWPVSKPMFEYLVNNKVIDGGSETLMARQKFFALKNLAEVTPEMLETAALTWENLISHFGSSKATWEMAIPLMGEMALMRNLRNFEQAGISEDAWKKVHEKLGMVADTKQLPFRFFAADQQVTSGQAKLATEAMLDAACQNVAALDGVTVVMVDNSGSAVGCAVGGKSTMRVSDCGNMLAAIAARRNGPKNTIVGVFGDRLIWVPFGDESAMAIKKKIDAVAQTEDCKKYKALSCEGGRGYDSIGCGGGTETGLWLGIHDLTKRKVHVDRFVLISDFCCYTQGDVNCGVNMTKALGTGGDKATIQSLLDKYRRQVNANVWVHSIDLQGYGQPQLRPGAERTQQLSGWSEQVYTLIRAAEGAVAAQPDVKEVPTISLLRETYKLA